MIFADTPTSGPSRAPSIEERDHRRSVAAKAAAFSAREGAKVLLVTPTRLEAEQLVEMTCHAGADRRKIERATSDSIAEIRRFICENGGRVFAVGGDAELIMWLASIERGLAQPQVVPSELRERVRRLENSLNYAAVLVAVALILGVLGVWP